MRAHYEAVDWASTALGPVEDWSPALRAAVDLTLRTRFPVTLMWGPEFVMVYNEAFIKLIGDKHPAALGSTAADVFPEAWHQIGPMLDSVAEGGEPVYLEDELVALVRHGHLDESYFTFCYSPVHGEDGAFEGIIDLATETTDEVISRRRLAMLTRLREALTGVERADDVREQALAVLREAPRDLPGVDILRVGVDELPGGRTMEILLEPPGEHRVLVFRPDPQVESDPAYREFLGLVATSIAQTYERIVNRDAERRMSETLQRSLLAPPRPREGMDIAARYLPAADTAQVGGDWYDAFALRDGSLAIAIGDVTGHDQLSAAAMAQMRSLLRGVAHSSQGDTPGRVLAALEEAMSDLAIGVFATGVLGVISDPVGDGRVLRWSNAGHPPPAVLAADGTVTLLSTSPDPLLGAAIRERGDHSLVLGAGDAVVLYTDGLVERRGASLDRGLAWLGETLAAEAGGDAGTIADRLLAALGTDVEDDVAVLVLRVL